MKLRLRVVLAFVLLGTAAAAGTYPSAAGADEGFRCESGRIVSRGDHSYEVRKNCGDPDHVARRTETRKVKYRIIRWVQGVAEEATEEREVEVQIDEWVYDMGPNRLVRFVSFENGRVIDVRAGEFGRKLAQRD
jgi:hypothetical protein